MRIASFNMRQGGSHGPWSAILSATNPEILFVQETKNPASFAGDLLQPLDLKGVVWEPVSHGLWGSALLVRDEVLTRVPVPGFSAWVVGGKVSTGSGHLFLFSFHLPPTENSYIKSANRLLDALGPLLSGSPVVLGGDWNLTVGRRTPHEEEKNRPGELELLERLEADFGLRSAWQAANPEAHLPQTLRWMRSPEIPYHCDGVFLPLKLAEEVRRAEVLSDPSWVALSDHNPLVVDLEPLSAVQRMPS